MTANDRPVVTRKGREHGDTAQSGGLTLITGVGPQHTPATRIWFGKASNPPGFRSLPHHHGEAETGAYLLSGRARIYFGENYQEYVEMSEGDFMFVPPFIPHLEANMSTTEQLWGLACRTPENIVVNLPRYRGHPSRGLPPDVKVPPEFGWIATISKPRFRPIIKLTIGDNKIWSQP